MKTEKKIFYTDSAKERLEKFHIEINQRIDKYLHDRKYIPGEDFIEVTAADIEEISNNIRFIKSPKTSLKKLIPATYAIMGILLVVFGLLYDDIRKLIENQPTRLIFIVSGLVMFFLGYFYLFLINSREKREDSKIGFSAEKKKELDIDHIEPISNIKVEKVIENIDLERKSKPNLVIHSAKYYYNKNWINVTEKIKELVNNNIFEFTVSNDLMGGDPFWGKPKTLEIDYTINGIKKKMTTIEKAIAKLQ